MGIQELPAILRQGLSSHNMAQRHLHSFCRSLKEYHALLLLLMVTASFKSSAPSTV